MPLTFDIALKKRFTTSSSEMALVDIDGADHFLIHDTTSDTVYKLTFANLTLALVSASGFTEIAQDAAASLIQNGTGISWVYNDGSNTLTPTITLAPFTTTNLAEGTNLYYTTARFTTAFATKSTTDLAEGSNLYYTDERTQDAVATLIQSGTGISWSYNDVGNTLTPTVTLSPFSTTNLSEGSNLYYTDERAQDAIAAMIAAGSGISVSYNDVGNSYSVSIDVNFSPTWSGNHTFSNTVSVSGLLVTGTTSVANGLYVVSSNNCALTGTTTLQLQVNGTTQAYYTSTQTAWGLGATVPTTSTTRYVFGVSGNGGIEIANLNGASRWLSKRYNGTYAVPTKVLNTNTLALFRTEGYQETTGAFFAVATFDVVATEDWTSTANGHKITFRSVATGSASASNSLILQGSQSQFASGSVTSPSVTFQSDLTSGLYLIGSNNIGLSINSTKILDIGSTGLKVVGLVKSTSPTAGVGYDTGAGGSVTQATSRTTGVTLNKICGAVTLVSAAGLATYQTFTVTNSAVAATDVVVCSLKSGTTDKYEINTTAAAGSFDVTFRTTGGTTTEQPVFNFAILKVVTS